MAGLMMRSTARAGSGLYISPISVRPCRLLTPHQPHS